MTPQQPFELIYAPEVSQHLAAVDRKYYSLISSTIQEQLSYQPEVETRNRKPLTKPTQLGATWELRLGPKNEFRVFYRTESEERKVYILAIGIKEGNILSIGREELEL